MSFFNWVYNNKPVVREEYEFLYHRDDFVLLGNQEEMWLGSLVERLWALLPQRVFEVRCPSIANPSFGHTVWSIGSALRPNIVPYFQRSRVLLNNAHECSDQDTCQRCIYNLTNSSCHLTLCLTHIRRSKDRYPDYLCRSLLDHPVYHD